MSTNIELNYVTGLPPIEFYKEAWVDEPVTNALPETNISFSLAKQDETTSLIAIFDQTVIGQCSSNKTEQYWGYLDREVEQGKENFSTYIFFKVHRKAMKIEITYLKSVNESVDNSFHNAGIAVMPKYRGKNIGLALTSRQIDLLENHKATTLFCETTNKYSANIVKELGFIKVAEFPYSQLAEELDYSKLNKIDDSFSVWCFHFGKKVTKSISLVEQQYAALIKRKHSLWTNDHARVLFADLQRLTLLKGGYFDTKSQEEIKNKISEIKKVLAEQINAPNNVGGTPVQGAADADDEITMKELIEYGADLSIPEPFYEGTVLHVAVNSGSLDAPDSFSNMPQNLRRRAIPLGSPLLHGQKRKTSRKKS